MRYVSLRCERVKVLTGAQQLDDGAGPAPIVQPIACIHTLAMLLTAAGPRALAYEAHRSVGVQSSDPTIVQPVATLGLNFPSVRTEDNFRFLGVVKEQLLIGAKNSITFLNLEDFSNKTLHWFPTDGDVATCLRKGQDEFECQNFIRAYGQNANGSFLLCGTNAFQPKCRIYEYLQDQYVVHNEFFGSGIVPYDPWFNATFLYVSNAEEMYTGTTADFAGTDALIYKQTTREADKLGLRTKRNDIKCLSEPNFVSSFADKEHVYFWFSEGAVEYMSCGKAVISRVARVCKNDRGGASHSSAYSWTSFLKARLNCSIPGEFPYYFDKIVATSRSPHGEGREDELVYALFNSPYNRIPGSAVCAFQMNKIRDIFANSGFKAQDSPYSSWQTLMDSEIPKPRPGSCVEDSHALHDDVVNFITKNPLMNDVVPNAFETPLLVKMGSQSVFTQIVVDSQVEALDSHKYDVIFIGTDSGAVLKLVNVGAGAVADPIVIEKVHVFADHSPISRLFLHRPRKAAVGKDESVLEPLEPRLVVMSLNEVRVLPVHYCGLAKSCSECVSVRDPYCVWDVRAQRCFSLHARPDRKNELLQHISKQPYGKSCPPEPENRVPTRENNGNSKTMLTNVDQSGRFKDFVYEDRKCNCADSGYVSVDGLPHGRVAQPRSSSLPVIVQERNDNTVYCIVLTLIPSLLIGFLAGYFLRSLNTFFADKLKLPPGVDQSLRRIRSSIFGSNAIHASAKTVEQSPPTSADARLNNSFTVGICAEECDKKPDNLNRTPSFLPADYKAKQIFL